MANARRAKNAGTAGAARPVRTPASGPELVTVLFQLQLAVKLFHWQTRDYAAHVESGKLFDNIIELTDEIIEQYIGLFGRPRMAAGAAVALPNMTAPALAAALRDGMAYMDARMPPAPNLLALRDELVGDIARALFLLSMR